MTAAQRGRVLAVLVVENGHAVLAPGAVVHERPEAWARAMEKAGAAGLVVALRGRGPREPHFREDLARRVARSCGLPLTMGGGLRTVEDVGGLLEAGAGRVLLGRAVLTDPALLDHLASETGSEALVVAVDAKARMDGSMEVVAGGDAPTGRDAVAWCREAARRGAGALLLTALDRAGACEGMDVELIRGAAAAVEIPLLAAGGAGSAEHVREALAAGASAVASAAALQTGRLRIASVAQGGA